MQFPPTLNSQTAIKQLYRQYSTTFKNVQSQKNPTMTQSSNLPFNNFYNAFNSTGHIKNLTLDRFKHSEANSIIQKLMQTREFPSKNQLDQVAFLNEIQQIDISHQVGPIPLLKTEQKIFNEVVNLISEIEEIRQKTQTQNEQFIKIKIQLKQQGIELPQPENPTVQSSSQTFKRYTSQQLQSILEANDQMQSEIDTITKELTNLNPHQSNPQTLVESYGNRNALLKKELSALKLQVINAGDVDEQDFIETNARIEELKTQIYMLQQKRVGRFNEADEELLMLKHENESLRLRTVELLKKPTSNTLSQRRADVIRILKLEEQQKVKHFERMSQLKEHYDSLMIENSRLKRETVNMGSQFEGSQIESKVSSFQNNFGEFRSSYGKENYLQNFEYGKAKRSGYALHEDSVFKQGKSGVHHYYN